MARWLPGSLLCIEVQFVCSLTLISGMPQSKERIWVIRGLIVLGLISSAVAVFTEIPAGGADNYAHFNIARWAFRYPHLFLDHWGKPVFTILTAPFAQLGLTAVRIFNIVAGLLTSWFCYRIASQLNLKAAWIAAGVAVFTPIYFVMMSSGMTEVLFSLCLVASIYLFFKEKYLWSAVIISFLFLIRSEGLVLLVFFFFALLIKKKYSIIPFLFSGYILFSLIGWVFHYHDLWWLITKRPYGIGYYNVYGSGAWYHYLKNMPQYFGPVIPVFILAGTVVILARWIKAGRLFSSLFVPVLLILGSFWGYLFIHSFMWWVGNTSAGLFRVMAGVSPLIGIMAAFAVDAVSNKVNRHKMIYSVLLLLPVLYMAGAAGEYYHRSVTRNATTRVLDRATSFLRKPENIKHKMVVHNPFFAYSTGKDAWDTNEIQYGFSNNEFPETGLPDSTLFVWDAHFSANEGHMPLSMIMNHQDFKLIEFFEPDIPFKVLGGNDYQIRVFRKISGANPDNEAILQNLRLEGVETGTYYMEEFAFENSFQQEEQEKRRIPDEENKPGFIYTLEDIEFSPAFHIPAEAVKEKGMNKIRASVEVTIPDELKANQTLMVFSVEGPDKVHHYAAADFTKQNLQVNVWNETEFMFIVPSELNERTVLKIYIWNIGKNEVLIDNFKVEIFQ
jgi:hypothetical protein